MNLEQEFLPHVECLGLAVSTRPADSNVLLILDFMIHVLHQLFYKIIQYKTNQGNEDQNP